MKPLHMLPIAALVGSIFGNPVLAADEAATETTPVKAEIKEVRVKGQRNAPAAVERVNLGRIQQEMVRDNKDLVRYSTDVGLSDSGRHQKGFAVRGVEGNRVGVSIDGVNLPDSEENSLYARYGNFNSSRLSIDPELVRNIEIVKGADSFNTGSGALGGGVNYQTLQGHDLLLPERQFGVMMKNGYSSRNREWTNTVGFGMDNGSVDAALLAGPAAYNAQKSGLNVVTTGKGVITPVIVTATSGEFYKKHKDIVEKFKKAQDEILDYIKANEGEALKFTAEETGLSIDAVKSMYPQYDFSSKITADDIKALEATQEFMLESKMIEHKIDIKSLLLN